MLGVGDVGDQHDAAAQLQRRLDRVGRARAAPLVRAGRALADPADPVRRRPGDRPPPRWCGSCSGPARAASSTSYDLAVDADAHEAGLAHVLEDALVLALAVLDQRRQDQQAAAVGHAPGSLSTICSAVCALISRPQLRAVRHADAGIEQAQVVVDLGDGAHGRARVAAGALLVDRDGRAEALRSGRRPAFPSARGTGGRRPRATRRSGAGLRRRWCRRPGCDLPRAGQAGDDDQLVAGDLQVDVLQVVFARAAHDQFVHVLPPNIDQETRRYWGADGAVRVALRTSVLTEVYQQSKHRARIFRRFSLARRRVRTRNPTRCATPTCYFSIEFGSRPIHHGGVGRFL